MDKSMLEHNEMLNKNEVSNKDNKVKTKPISTVH